MVSLILGIIALLFRSSEAAFCTVPYDCDSTCYRLSTYKTLCGSSECYKSRLEPYVCKETCYEKACCQGYTGDDCLTPLCFGSPICPNGGRCVSPDMCNSLCFGSPTCPNGGRCESPDLCNCLPGFYGKRCSACGILPNINNGQFKLHTTGAGTDTVARLECAAGYMQKPDPTRQFELHCDTDGLWSPDNINVTCDILDCGTPDKTVPHGHFVALNGTYFGNQALLQCDQGYNPQSDPAFIQCTSTGSWSDTSMQCVQGSNTCESGWLSNDKSCYLFVLTEMNYTDARRICLDQNSTLVQVDTLAENLYLKGIMFQFDQQNQSPKYGYWNDLFETTVNGQEVWRESNTPLNPLAADWQSTQPDDRNGNQTCTMFFKGYRYQWADIEYDAVGKANNVDNEGVRMARPLCEKII